MRYKLVWNVAIDLECYGLNRTDNEYSQQPIQHAEYFAQLEAKYRANGIVVPLYVSATAGGLLSLILIQDI